MALWENVGKSLWLVHSCSGKVVYVKRQESPDQRRLINTKGLRLPPEYNGMSLKDLQWMVTWSNLYYRNFMFSPHTVYFQIPKTLTFHSNCVFLTVCHYSRIFFLRCLDLKHFRNKQAHSLSELVLEYCSEEVCGCVRRPSCQQRCPYARVK